MRPLAVQAVSLVLAGMVLRISLGLTLRSLMPVEMSMTGVLGLLEATAAVTGTLCALGSLLLVARIPALERVVGQDRLIRLHRSMATWASWLIVAHVLADLTRAEASQAMAGVRARLEAWVRTVDEVFSTWGDDSLAIGLRRGLLTEADLGDLGEYGRLMAEEIARCRDLRALTRGAFDPRDTGRPCASVPLSWPADLSAARGGIATSGWSEQCSHVIDPRTGEAPHRGVEQASVIGPDAAVADAFATALLIDGIEGFDWFRPFMEADTRVGRLHSRWAALIVQDGRVWTLGALAREAIDGIDLPG